MIKTITAHDSEEFDQRVNAFCQVKNVFATQTHVQQIATMEGAVMLYTAVVFFKDPADYNRS